MSKQSWRNRYQRNLLPGIMTEQLAASAGAAASREIAMSQRLASVLDDLDDLDTIEAPSEGRLPPHTLPRSGPRSRT